MIEAIRHGLASMLRFGGREGRRSFWYYVLFVVVVSFFVSAGFLQLSAGTTMASAVTSGTAPDAEGLPLAEPGALRTQFLWALALGIAQIPLLTAALVRRGHDAGVPAVVSLLSPALYAASLVILGLNIPVLTEHLVSAQNQASLLIQTAFRMPQLAIGLLQFAALGLGLIIGLRRPLTGRNPYGRGAFNV